MFRRTRVRAAFARHDPDPTPPAPAGDPPPNPDPKDPPKTFTQAELDAAIGDRLARERAKYSDYDALKEKASKFDQAEQEKLSELDREKTARETAERAAVDAASKANAALRRSAIVAEAALGQAHVPAQVVALVLADKAFADRITVTDDGEVEGAKDAVADFLKANPHLVRTAPATPPPLPGQGQGGDPNADKVDPTDRKSVEKAAAALGVRL